MSMKRGGYSDAMLVRILYHHEPEGWWAESPDMERWTAVGRTFEEVRRLGEEGARVVFEDRPVEVEHYLPETSVLVKAG